MIQFETYEKDDLLIVKPKVKRLDAIVAVSFKDKITEFINQGKKLILLNLNDVNFIDSSGLGAIVTILKRLGRDGKLYLCYVSEPVENMFKLTRMDKIFKIFDTEEQAIQSVK
ncbi:MAG: STAS domain-containing protein [Deltaproteobacteria bacterium]|nr:STAS domain-containing protein [Deltaproteobacteria bacterium]